MSEPLLNENQRRRVATFLQLLVKDLEQLKTHADLSEPIHGALDQVLESIDRLLRELDVALPTEPDLLHRVQVIAEVWSMRAHELRAAALRGYGALHPDLADRLNPLVEAVQRDLWALADATRDR